MIIREKIKGCGKSVNYSLPAFWQIVALLFFLTAEPVAQTPSPSPAVQTATGNDKTKSKPADASSSEENLLRDDDELTRNPPQSPPQFKPLRYDEDWSFLSDPDKRTDVWDKFKYIPLRKDKKDWFLTIGGEIRPTYEYLRNSNWGGGVQDSNGAFFQRYMLHFNVNLGRRARVFVEFKSGIASSRAGGPAPPDENYLDLHQAFVDFRFGFNRISSADGSSSQKTSEKPPTFTLRIGRQELAFGSERLVGVREGPNVRRNFNALNLIVNAGGWRVNAFAAKPTADNRRYFDDNFERSQTFWGVYAVRSLSFVPALRKSFLDVYYFNLDRKLARFEQGTGRDRRSTVGTRFSGAAVQFDYDLEFAFQFGTFGSGANRSRIRAYTAGVNIGYTFKSSTFSPRLGLGAGIGSGDKNLSDRRLQTFYPLFPRGAFFGQIAQNGPLNFIAAKPSLSLQLSKNVVFRSDYYFFWREATTDGIYGTPGNLVRTSERSRARFIGHQLDLNLIWQVNRNILVVPYYAHFFTGRFLRETPPARDIDFAGIKFIYKF